MKTNDKKDKFINALLADVYKETIPEDSWEALRVRIDHKLKDYECRSGHAKIDKSVTFWRRIAFAMAACLAITVGLLVYMIVSKEIPENTGTKNEALLSQSQLHQLSTTFSHVRQLFGHHSPWIVVNTAGDSEIGVDNKIARSTNDSKVIVLRLVVSLEEQKIKRQYFDVVTFSNQQAQFQIHLTGSLAMDVTTKPILKDDGTIAVEINAQVDNSVRTSGVGTVANNTLTSLFSMRVNGNWVNIDATAHSLSNI
jgi:hypothetical protein